MSKYEESIKRIGYNFGLDCLYGKTDVALNEDISNMYELLNKCEKLEKALDKACTLLANEHLDDCPDFKYENENFIYRYIPQMSKKEWKRWLLDE